MTDCNDIRKHLVLFVEEELDDRRRAEVTGHCERCAACHAELQEIRTLRGWLSDPEVFAPVEDYRWQTLPSRVTARSSHLPATRTWLPSNFAPAGWALSLVSMVALVCVLIWSVNTPQPPAIQASAPGNEAFLNRIRAEWVRGETSEYLMQCQDLLLNVVRAEQSCSGTGYDVSMEIDRARSLLRRKRLLDPELRIPEVAGARKLCDELENFLTNLTTLEACETSDRMLHMERVIEREQLLLRIQVVRSELL